MLVASANKNGLFRHFMYTRKRLGMFKRGRYYLFQLYFVVRVSHRTGLMQLFSVE